MGTILLTLLLLLFMLLSRTLQKTYRHIPAKELRRRARAGDSTAAALYRVVGYGVGLDMLLWFLVGLSGAVLFLLLAHHLNSFLAVLLTAIVLIVVFGWMPKRAPGKLSYRSAKTLAGPSAKVLSWSVPLTSRLGIWLRRFGPVTMHTGLYEKEDLLELLSHQSNQIDNRISEQELAMARGALTFGDIPIRDIMTPRRMVKTVKATDPISPHSMDELHATGFSRFPVLGEGDELVGTLFLRDMVGHSSGGQISSIMKPDVCYVNEEQSVLHTFNAFLKTKHHLFIVVNNFEEIVGVITIEDALEALLGKEIVDEFDQYENLRAVALQQAHEHRKPHNHVAVEESQPEEAA